MRPRHSEIEVTGWGDAHILSYPADESGPEIIVDDLLGALGVFALDLEAAEHGDGLGREADVGF